MSICQFMFATSQLAGYLQNVINICVPSLPCQKKLFASMENSIIFVMYQYVCSSLFIIESSCDVLEGIMRGWRTTYSLLCGKLKHSSVCTRVPCYTFALYIYAATDTFALFTTQSQNCGRKLRGRVDTNS